MLARHTYIYRQTVFLKSFFFFFSFWSAEYVQICKDLEISLFHNHSTFSYRYTFLVASICMVLISNPSTDSQFASRERTPSTH
jgi:hypothetical protein